MFTDDSSLKFHPLVVTHHDFVPFRQDVALGKGGDVELTVKLMPAATIQVTVLAENGKPLAGHLLLRLEALDGHRFIPPGRDRHLSSFAARNWSEYLTDGRFTFTELKEGRHAAIG